MYKTFLLFACFAPVAAAISAAVPAPPLPERWQYAEASEQTLPADDGWWSEFADPVLDSLINLGEEANYDIAIAVRRVEIARQQLREARTAWYPQIGLSGGYERARQAGVTANTYSAMATASWEIDIFGRVRESVKAGRNTYLASRADRVGTMVSVAAEIGSAYMQLRVWQAELAVAEAHISRQDTIAGIANARFECGLAAKVDVDQARGILYSTRATVPALRTSIRKAVNTLALLTGRYAAEIEPLLAVGSGLPDYRRLIPAGIPADILRRRPDVVAAEYSVAAAAAQVGIAKKDFLPSLTINGSVGVSSDGHGKFFSSDHLVYTVAPTLSWTLFDGMARSARVTAAREQEQSLVEQYRYTVMNAVAETDNALCAYTQAVRSIADCERAAAAASEFLTLSLELYTQGLSDFTNVANAQVSYLQYANSVITARGNALAALVDLYRALGGGYSLQL